MHRIAMIGTRGHYARVLAEIGDSPSLRVVGVCDGGDSAELLVEWCREHGHAPERFGDDYRAMLDGLEPDAVVVCGPFEMHAQMCIDAIERNVHVLTEKPAALTEEDLDRLTGACQRHPKVHLAGMMFSRYDPGFFTAKRLVAEGAIGDVRLINARKSYKLGKRPAYYADRQTFGGTIPWVGSHAIDWVLWIADRPFTSVYASHSSADNGNNGTMESSALCQFTLQGGVAASVSIDYFRPATAPTHGNDWLRVVGTSGVLEARPDSVHLTNGDGDGATPTPVSCDRRPLSDFIDHIDEKRPALIDVQSTLALTDACLRARRSADEARIIPFEPR